MRRFLYKILDHVGEPGAKKAGLFFLWFAVITGAIALIFLSLTFGGTIISGGFLVGMILSALMVAAAVFFWGLVLALTFGTVRAVQKGNDTVTFVSLFGRVIYTRIAGPWRAVQSLPMGDAPDMTLAWSRVALAAGWPAPRLIEAAIAYLVTSGRARAQIRTERRRIPLLSKDEDRRPIAYFHAGEESAPCPGLWENRLLDHLRHRNADTPIDTETWVIMAFGQASGDPQASVIRIAKQEDIGAQEIPAFLARDIGHFMARLYAPDPEIEPAIQQGIKDALENRVEVS